MRQAHVQNGSGCGKKILVIDGMIPRPDRDSGSLRMSHLLQLLTSFGYHVTFAAANLEAPQPYTGQLQAAGIEVLTRPDLPSLQNYLQWSGACFETVILSRVSVAVRYIEAVRQYVPQARVVFDTVDLHYVREFRGAKVTGNRALLKRALQTKTKELAAVNAADCTLVVSLAEKETLIRECPGAAVQIVSNIHHTFEPVPAFAPRKDLLFIGSFFHHPNIDAVHYFLADIFPLVKKKIAGVKIYIIGDNPPESIQSLAADDVIITGYIPDVSVYFNSCKVSVAPLRYGAGVKGKVHLSMSFGLPVVASSMAIEGMPFINNRHGLVVDTSQDFCQAIVSVYQDETLWTNISQNSQNLIKTHFSFEAAQRQLVKVLKQERTN
ncbi:glycosyltransferase [candidate division CSSED10-310 bacterium]|uniref:Glycosyltransferase n=1 Tax=candidate division CSSED10-310 bacterium TaxID=2855610 RepID=A0ABV6Z262_UNCC1